MFMLLLHILNIKSIRNKLNASVFYFKVRTNKSTSEFSLFLQDGTDSNSQRERRGAVLFALP